MYMKLQLNEDYAQLLSPRILELLPVVKKSKEEKEPTLHQSYC